MAAGTKRGCHSNPHRASSGRWVGDSAALKSAPAGHLLALSVTPLEISATRIRQLLAAGREPRYQLPSGLFDPPSLLAPYRQGQM